MSKTLIETSTMLAASIRCLLGSKNIQHQRYDVSKSLFNFFQNHITLQAGITTDTVIEQSWRTLDKAMGDTVEESTSDSVEYFDLMSKIKDTVEDNLRKNISLLAKNPIDTQKVDEILVNEITPFFYQVSLEVKQQAEQLIPVAGLKLKPSTLKAIQRSHIPYYKGHPDRTDKKIFAEAVYLKRTFFTAEQVYVASLDTHFSPARKDSIVRDKFNDSFGVLCEWPNEILSRLKKEYPDTSSSRKAS